MTAATNSQTVSTRAMRYKLVTYWIATSLVAAELVLGGIWRYFANSVGPRRRDSAGISDVFPGSPWGVEAAGCGCVARAAVSARQRVGLRRRILCLLRSHRVAFGDG